MHQQPLKSAGCSGSWPVRCILQGYRNIFKASISTINFAILVFSDIGIGGSCSYSPWTITYSKAESIHPPLHPWFPYDLEQSANCCSEGLTVSPLFKIIALSWVAVAQKAQHEPQDPWFLMAVTFPFATQSISPSMEADTEGSIVVQSLIGTLRVRRWPQTPYEWDR